MYESKSLRLIFPNICENDLLALNQFMKNFYLPICNGLKGGSWRRENDTSYEELNSSVACTSLTNYLVDYFARQSFYKIDFSSNKQMNQLITPFLLNTIEIGDECWTPEKIEQAASYLSREPALLPCIITLNSLNILSQLLGYDSFRNLEEFVYQNNDFVVRKEWHKNWPEKEKLYIQSLGFKHLAVFSALIEALSGFGVNLDAMPIFKAFDCYLYNRKPDFKYNFRNERNREYHSWKKFDFELSDFFSFKTLNEFLERVEYLVLNEISPCISIVDENQNLLMPDPATLDFQKYNYLVQTDYNFYEIVSLEALDGQRHFFDSYNRQNSLQLGAFTPIVPYLHYLKDLLEKQNQATKKFLEAGNQNSILDPENKPYHSFSPYIKNYQENLKKQEKMQQMQKQLYQQSKEIRHLKEKLEQYKMVEDYLNDGGNLSMDVLRKTDIEMIKKLMAKKPIKNSVGYYRRLVILYVLVGSLGWTTFHFKKSIESSVNKFQSNTVQDFSLFPGLNIMIPDGIQDPNTRKDFESNPSVDENVTKEKNENGIPLQLGAFFENTEGVPYYNTIYDTTPSGITYASGIYVAYFALDSNNEKKGSFRSVRDLEDFVSQNEENLNSYSWKAAICSLKDVAFIQEQIKRGDVIPTSYSSYFIDYDITPFLNYRREQILNYK